VGATGAKGTAGAGIILQRVSAAQADDIQTSDTNFDDVPQCLVAITTTAGTSLLIWAAFSALNTVAGGTLEFRILVDGVSIGGCGMNMPDTFTQNRETGALIFVKSVAAGNHTVQLQWRVGTASGVQTGFIRPVTFPDQENATLLVMESN